MKTRWLILACVCASAILGAQVTRVRLPVGPGIMYPQETKQLRAAVEQYTADARTADFSGRLAACIAPCSTYAECGAVAASAFKPLKPRQYDRVILLASSHTGNFEGCSIAAVQYYATPLGLVPLDISGIRRICWSAFATTRAVVYHPSPTLLHKRKFVHEVEHAAEHALPFLQSQLVDFELIPIVVGDMRDKTGRLDTLAIESVAENICRVLDDRTLIVVTSDFTRYGDRYGLKSSEEMAEAAVELLDKQAFHFILNRDYAGYREYLYETRNPIDGSAAIAILLKCLPKRTSGALLAYDSLGRQNGDFTESKSFAAIAFYDPTKSPPTPRKVKKKDPWKPADVSDISLGPLSPERDVVEKQE